MNPKCSSTKCELNGFYGRHVNSSVIKIKRMSYSTLGIVPQPTGEANTVE